MITTLNFNPRTDPKLVCACGHPNCDKRSVNQHSLDRAQAMRSDRGAPMIVTSGGRCPHHPDEMHRDKPADHQLGWALDFKCTSESEETKIKVLAGRYGATRVAGNWRDGFVHVAWTPTERADVPTWAYR